MHFPPSCSNFEYRRSQKFSVRFPSVVLLGSKVFPRKVSGILLNPKTSFEHIRPMEDSANPGLSLSIFEMCRLQTQLMSGYFFPLQRFHFQGIFFHSSSTNATIFRLKIEFKSFFLLKKLLLPPNIFSLSRLGQSGLNTLKVVF